MMRATVAAGWVLASFETVASNSDGPGILKGSLLPKINSDTWEGFEPSAEFARDFNSWPDRKVPDEMLVWCKGFIPHNATQEVVNGQPVMPIKGPMGLPIPGLLGQCAEIDGRDWNPNSPQHQRPTDSRFWAHLSVANGHGKSVVADANCGMSKNICCEKNGCWDGSSYGDITCNEHCPDTEMNMKKVACWTPQATQNGQTWPTHGESCQGNAAGPILAAKAYIQGRGGNPCGTVAGVHPPPASWDVGVAIFPTKRKVTITGYVDDAPSYECYAQAKDNGVWGPSVTLAQIPMDMSSNIAIALAGYADRPINPENKYFDLPLPHDQNSQILV